MADETNLNVDTPIGDLSNLADAPDDALLVVEYLGKAYNSTLGQLKAALGAITSFERTQGDGTPGSTDIYTVTFANGGKLEMPIPIAKNGTDAVSPTAEVTATDTGWHVVIIDKNGEHPFDITNGKNGANGVSPTAEVTATDTGWHVVITDKNGEHPFDITNGKDGADGVSPTAKVTATDTGWHVVITDKNGEHPFDLLHGLNGKDGVSPDVSVQQVSGGYRVTITDKDGAHYFTLKNGESSSADWAQKYPDGVGYVENRIAYKDVYGVDGSVIVGNVDFIAGVANVAGLMKDALEPGGKYVVRWNNQPYHCICKESLTDGPYIGNGALFGGAEDLENTGEPFCIYRFTEDYYQIIKDTDTEETVLVEVYGFAVIDLKRMDGDLLPEGYPYRETVEIAIMAEQLAMLPSETDFGKSTEIVELTVGGQYIVNWDGKEYPCVGKEYVTDELTSVCIGDVSSLTGGESTGEPFAVVMVPGDHARIYRHIGNITTKISVTEIKEVVHPMDKEFIPDGVGVTDYNKLENRPVGKEVTHSDTLTWDGNTDGLVSAVEVLFKVSDAVPTKEDCANGLSLTIAGQTMTVPGEDVQAMFADDGFANLEYAAVVPTDNYDAGDDLVFPEAGVYFASADGMAVTELVIPGYTGFTATKIQKLDMAFLPEGYPYKTVERVEVLPETTVEAAEEVPIMTEIELVEGNTYTVKWNGTEYTCVAQGWAVDGTPAGVIVGDIGMLETGEPTTGEPFLIADLNEDMAADFGVPTILMCIDGSTSVTLSITGEAEVVQKMDDEYLPDGIPSATPFDDVIMAAWPSSLNGGYFSDPVGTVVAGNVYKVNWDGVKYDCVARRNPENEYLILGNGNNTFADRIGTEHPFTIMFASPADAAAYGVTGLIIADSDPTENVINNFSIVGSLKVKKLNKYCLPQNYDPVIVRFGDDGSFDVPWDVVRQAAADGRNVTAIYKGYRLHVSYADLSELAFAGIYSVFSNGEFGALKAVAIHWYHPRYNDGKATITEKTLTTT